MLDINQESNSDQFTLKTEELEKCFNIICEWVHQDKTFINILLNTELDIEESIIKPFRKELDNNLFKFDPQRKHDILRQYMHKFYDVQDLFEEYDDLLSIGKLDNYADSKFKYTNEDGATRKLKKYENYVIECHKVYQSIFHEIRNCCIIHQVDFKQLCSDLFINTNYIEKDITGIDRNTFDNFEELPSDFLVKLIEWENENEIKNDHQISVDNNIPPIIKPQEMQKDEFDLKEINEVKLPESTTKLISFKEIALIFVYERKMISRSNAKSIASKYGYNSPNSGEGLFQDFITFSSETNRTGKPTPYTPKKLKNKIDLFNKVVEYLDDEPKKKAAKEVQVLMRLFENDFQ